MISHKYECIYIHIPKCAGTSVESIFGHLDNHVGRGGQDHRSIRMIKQPCFSISSISSKENIIELLHRNKYLYINKVSNYRNKFKVTKQQYENYYKFSIVRNPWARAYSWYKNVMRDEIHLKNHGISEEISFNNFLKKFAGKGFLRPQLYWLKDFDGVVSLDYIARFETLSADMQNIFKQLGVREFSLPHNLKGSEDNYRNHYDLESNAIIQKIYQEEIVLFDYSFD